MRLLDLFLESTGVCTDSRTLKEGNLFFALKGDNFNGNLFASNAIQLGASFAIVDEEIEPNDKIIKVNNTLNALQNLAREYRIHLGVPVLAITGSNGKTTSKELIAAVLSKKYNLNYTKGNLNNEIGVPLTILNTSLKNDFLIVEMGANHQGEIDTLARIALPNFGYITNIGKAHLEGFGGIEGVIKGKGELFNYIEETKGIIFYNCEEPIISSILNKNLKSIKFKISDFSIIENFPFLHLMHKDGFEIKSNLAGTYNINNIAAAYVIGIYFSINIDDIINSLEAYLPTNNRSQVIEMDYGIRIIKDAYNANPSSVMSSLNSFLSEINDDKVIVLGDMLELGAYGKEEHEKILDYVNSKKVYDAIFVGPIYNAFKGQYLDFKFYENVEECKNDFFISNYKSKTILIKGSRGIALEKLVPMI